MPFRLFKVSPKILISAFIGFNLSAHFYIYLHAANVNTYDDRIGEKQRIFLAISNKVSFIGIIWEREIRAEKTTLWRFALL